MKRIDIVLIKPGSQKQIYGELSDFGLTAIEPPLWPAILAGYLRGLGYSVLIFDAEAENWDYDETARRVVEAKPLLAAVIVSGSNPSASTMNMTGAGKIARKIASRGPSIRTLLGGLHPSALPERTLVEEAVDYVCQGEGFFTYPALIDALRGGNSEITIDGLWRSTENGPVPAPRPELLKDLDSLPLPAWDLLPMNRYRAHNWHCFDDINRRQPYAVLYTSLGCPFRCSFCCINALFGKHTIRYRSIDSVMEEIDLLVNTYGVRNIKIMDEMFAMNEKRVIAMCNRIAGRGYDLNMWAYARVNTVTQPMLASMKAAGINWLAYGFESGSERVIKSVSKGYQPDQLATAVADTCAEGIHICANYIFGLPEDDFESMNQTLAMMLEINAEWANIYCAMAYPGSELFALAAKNKWPLPGNWNAYSQYAYDTLPLKTNYLSGGEVLAFRDYAFDVYYRNPGVLNKIRRTFCTETVDHIVKMSSKRLKRKNISV